MEIVAFTPASALLLATLASQHALTEEDVCAVLRGLRADHARHHPRGSGGAARCGRTHSDGDGGP